MRTKGKITSWNDGKGYGFISPVSGGKQVFVHINAFSNRNRRPEIGQVVTYGISSDKQGRPCAVKATLARDRLQQNEKNNIESISIATAGIFIGILTFSVVGGNLPPVVLIIYVGLSILTFFAYALDKAAATKGSWRTQESTLHLFALLGGWPGALVAQQKLRHKSKKASFRTVFWVTVVFNCCAFVWLFSSAGAALVNSFL